jgi:hypothetical protein
MSDMILNFTLTAISVALIFVSVSIFFVFKVLERIEGEIARTQELIRRASVLGQDNQRR